MSDFINRHAVLIFWAIILLPALFYLSSLLNALILFIK